MFLRTRKSFSWIGKQLRPCHQDWQSPCRAQVVCHRCCSGVASGIFNQEPQGSHLKQQPSLSLWSSRCHICDDTHFFDNDPQNRAQYFSMLEQSDATYFCVLECNLYEGWLSIVIGAPTSELLILSGMYLIFLAFSAPTYHCQCDCWHQFGVEKVGKTVSTVISTLHSSIPNTQSKSALLKFSNWLLMYDFCFNSHPGYPQTR